RAIGLLPHLIEPMYGVACVARVSRVRNRVSQKGVPAAIEYGSAYERVRRVGAGGGWTGPTDNGNPVREICFAGDNRDFDPCLGPEGALGTLHQVLHRCRTHYCQTESRRVCKVLLAVH